jgi:hypothetical protein
MSAATTDPPPGAPPNCVQPVRHRDWWHDLPGQGWRCVAFACLPRRYRAAMAEALATPAPFAWRTSAHPADCADLAHQESWHWEAGVLVCDAWRCFQRRMARDVPRCPPTRCPDR